MPQRKTFAHQIVQLRLASLKHFNEVKGGIKTDTIYFLVMVCENDSANIVHLIKRAMALLLTRFVPLRKKLQHLRILQIIISL